MQRYGVGLLPYYPLAGGLLSGKYRRDALPAGARLTDTKRSADRFLTERNWRVVEALEAFARERGKSLLDVAIGWLASRPVVSSVIAGATSPEQVEANVAAAATRFSADDLAALDKLAARPA